MMQPLSADALEAKMWTIMHAVEGGQMKAADAMAMAAAARELLRSQKLRRNCAWGTDAAQNEHAIRAA